MVTLSINDKEFKLVPTTRKVVDLTDKLKAKNLNDLIFTALNDCDLKILAEIIKSFAQYEDGKSVFTSINNVYDFIDTWRSENSKGNDDLFREVIEVTNEMGFFKSKMTEEEINQMMINPLPAINMNELIKNSAQNMVDKIVEEEFRGYQA